MLILKKNNDFQTVFKNGKWYSSKFLVVYCHQNHKEKNRIGIAVGKKIAKSVQRNRIRRIIREAYQKIECSLIDSYDIVIVAKNSIASQNLKMQDIQVILITLFQKANIYVENIKEETKEEDRKDV